MLLNLITVLKPASSLLWQINRISFCYEFLEKSHFYLTHCTRCVPFSTHEWLSLHSSHEYYTKNPSSSSQHYLNSYKWKQWKYQTSSKLRMNNFFYHPRNCWNTHKYSIWQWIAVKKNCDQSNKDLQMNLKMWSSSLSPYRPC